jgi:hypothetical protein
MSSQSLNRYQSRMTLTFTLYAIFMLFVWPAVRTVQSFPLKVLLAIAPAIPIVYMLRLAAQHISASDEFEQRTHLISLGVAVGVVSALSIVGGFLSVAGVMKLDGSVLLWVFPALSFSYSIARWRVMRSYGESMWGECAHSLWLSLNLVLVGAFMLAVAWLCRLKLSGYPLGFIYGTGAAFLGMGIVFGVVNLYRRRIHHE